MRLLGAPLMHPGVSRRGNNREICSIIGCTRSGPSFRTYTGRHWHPLDPDPWQIHAVDIARSHAFTCRFGGHLEDFYSDAQHCVLVCEALRQLGAEEQREGLLHEVAEAYSGFGDVTTVKLDEAVRACVKPIERSIDDCASVRFGLPIGFAEGSTTKNADHLLLAAEDRDLRGLDAIAEHGRVSAWPALDAEWRWLRWFQYLFPDDRDRNDVAARLFVLRPRVSWAGRSLAHPFEAGRAPEQVRR